MVKTVLPFTHKFFCEDCNIKTNNKNHIFTLKHMKQTNSLSNKLYICELCNKEYKSRVGLWKHKKKLCLNNKTSNNLLTDNLSTDNLSTDNFSTDKELIMMLVKQNTELMNLLKNGTNNTTNTNCMNKTFNLNFFLNETCKDAMNINDFIDSIKIQLVDLEKMGEIGYIESISNIITSNLKIMDITERPVHCTDKKRETIYIKDNNKWEKDNNKTKIRKAIKQIASKNFKLLPEYREKYPGCQYADSECSDKYNKLMIEVLGGEGNNDIEKENKIIHNISKNVVI
jgi:hypothetical protein